MGFHKNRKLTGVEWAEIVNSGKLEKAIRALKPVKAAGPWHVLCDGEGTLQTRESQAAHARIGVNLWVVPASSPDLNPVEQMWAWLRRELRRMDRDDLQAKRPAIDRTAFKARVRSLLATKKAARTASRIAGRYRKTCEEVQRD